MKSIEDIKNFEDIDTYYEISNIVEEVFQDRVEAHKHLVTANKEIGRLNNIINETRRILGEYKHYSTPDEIQNKFNEEIVDKAYIKLYSNLQELKGDSCNE